MKVSKREWLTHYLVLIVSSLVQLTAMVDHWNNHPQNEYYFILVIILGLVSLLLIMMFLFSGLKNTNISNILEEKRKIVVGRDIRYIPTWCALVSFGIVSVISTPIIIGVISLIVYGALLLFGVELNFYQ